MKRRLSDEGRLSMRQERMLGVVMLVAGLAIAGVAVTRMGPDGVVQAQVTPQTAPPAAAQDKPAPAESMPGGTRPTTPAPEPARPQNNQNNQGSTTGTAPANAGDRAPTIGTPLPPAPAEKTGAPLQRK